MHTSRTSAAPTAPAATILRVSAILVSVVTVVNTTVVPVTTWETVHTGDPVTRSTIPVSVYQVTKADEL